LKIDAPSSIVPDEVTDTEPKLVPLDHAKRFVRGLLADDASEERRHRYFSPAAVELALQYLDNAMVLSDGLGFTSLADRRLMMMRHRIIELARLVGDVNALDECFQKVDGNNDGFVDLREFKVALTLFGDERQTSKMGISFFDMTERDVEDLFHFLDDDRRGLVLFAELSPQFARLCPCVHQDHILEACLRAWELSALQVGQQIRKLYVTQLQKQRGQVQLMQQPAASSSSSINSADSSFTTSSTTSRAASPTSSTSNLNRSSSSLNVLNQVHRHPWTVGITTLDQFAEMMKSIIEMAPRATFATLSGGITQQAVLSMYRTALAIEEKRPSNFADINGDLPIQPDTYAFVTDD
jgi:Fe-S-cluster formation regulator IscX/YfhJ